MSIGYRIRLVNTPVRIKFGDGVKVGDRVELDANDRWPRRFGWALRPADDTPEQEPDAKAEDEPQVNKQVRRPRKKKGDNGG